MPRTRKPLTRESVDRKRHVLFAVMSVVGVGLLATDIRRAQHPAQVPVHLAVGFAIAFVATCVGILEVQRSVTRRSDSAAAHPSEFVVASKTVTPENYRARRWVTIGAPLLGIAVAAPLANAALFDGALAGLFFGFMAKVERTVLTHRTIFDTRERTSKSE